MWVHSSWILELPRRIYFSIFLELRMLSLFQVVVGFFDEHIGRYSFSTLGENECDGEFSKAGGFSFLFFLVNKIVFTYLLLCVCAHVCFCISTTTPPRPHHVHVSTSFFFSFIKIYLFFSPFYPTCKGIST